MHFHLLTSIQIIDDATTCAFSRGCYEISGTAIKAVSGGLPHSGKHDFLNIVKTNIPLRFKETIQIR
jgi:hypothetical protein